MRVLDELAEELVDDLPSWAREAPEFRANARVAALESARMRERAAEVRDCFILQRVTGLGLAWWEAFFGITRAAGADDVEAREALLAALRATIPDSRGTTWEQHVEELAGGAEYVEGDGTITVTVPFPPGSEAFLRLERAIRVFTPAHLDIVISSGEGFVLDLSQLDEEPFHPS